MKTFEQWIAEQEKLCNPEKLIPFSVEESRRQWAVQNAMPTALKIIRCLEAGIRNHGHRGTVMENIEKILNEEQR